MDELYIYRIETKRKRYLVLATSKNFASGHLWDEHNESLPDQRFTHTQRVTLPCTLRTEDLPDGYLRP